MQHRMSQTELARRAGVSQPTVSTYENNPGAGYRAEVLFRIAGALGTSPEYLMHGSGPVNLSDLKADQKELLAVIDQLPEAERAVLLSVAKSMRK